MTERRAVVVAFDFDGTLTTGDCVRPFLECLGGRSGIVRALARRPSRVVAGVIRRDRDELKDVVVGGVFNGRDVDEVNRQGRAFAEVVHASMLRPDMLKRLRWHQRMGHRAVLVSASLRSYLEPLAQLLDVERALCTDVATSDGIYLGRLDGPNCRAAEKVVRLKVWMAEQGLDSAQVWAYGDSRGDRELIEAADHGVWVRGVLVPPTPSEFAQ